MYDDFVEQISSHLVDIVWLGSFFACTVDWLYFLMFTGITTNNDAQPSFAILSIVRSSWIFESVCKWFLPRQRRKKNTNHNASIAISLSYVQFIIQASILLLIFKYSLNNEIDEAMNNNTNINKQQKQEHAVHRSTKVNRVNLVSFCVISHRVIYLSLGGVRTFFDYKAILTLFKCMMLSLCAVNYLGRHNITSQICLPCLLWKSFA